MGWSKKTCKDWDLLLCRKAEINYLDEKVKLNEGRTCPTVSAWCYEDFLPKLLPVDLTTSYDL